MIQLSEDRLLDVSLFPVPDERRDGTTEKMKKWHDGRFVWPNYKDFTYEYLTWCIELCAELDYQTEVDLLDEALTQKELDYKLTEALTPEQLKDRLVKRITSLAGNSDNDVIYCMVDNPIGKSLLMDTINHDYPCDSSDGIFDIYGSESESEYDTALILSYDGDELVLDILVDSVKFEDFSISIQNVISMLKWVII